MIKSLDIWYSRFTSPSARTSDIICSAFLVEQALLLASKQAITVQRVFDLKEQDPSWSLIQLAEQLNEV